MSVFSNTANWPAGCLSANQSPINLSITSAKPCKLSCDFVMDSGTIAQATTTISTEGLYVIPHSKGSIGSCKFKGESYVCFGLFISHPSHHTLEGVQADGEVIAICSKPTGEMLMVSSLFRVNSEQTPSYTFFKQFVPYAQTSGSTNVMLQDWSLNAMVPPGGGYFVYSGSSVSPPCKPTEWVVFKNMINIDQGDFAYLVRNVQAGSRPVQALGDREVFFNDDSNAGAPMPANKLYLRLRQVTGTAKKPEVDKVDLKSNIKQSKEDAQEELEHPTTYTGQLNKASHQFLDVYGYTGVIVTIFSVLLIVAGIYYGRKGSESTPFKAEFAKTWAVWTREKLFMLWTYILAFFEWLLSFVKSAWDWTINFIPAMFARFKAAAEAKAAERAARLATQSSSATKPSSI